MLSYLVIAKDHISNYNLHYLHYQQPPTTSAPNPACERYCLHQLSDSNARCKHSAPTTAHHLRGICGKPGFLGGVIKILL